MFKFYYSLYVILATLVINEILGCSRVPRNLPHGRRNKGSNGYKLTIADNPSGYEPGRTYNIFLHGSQTHENLQSFTHFKITAEAVKENKRKTVESPVRVGRFQLFGDSLTKFNEDCINVVSNADDLPKTEIQVMWVAPKNGSGCISLAAMIYENPRSWYADDDELTKIICEKKLTKDTVKKECCACDEAKYKFIFEGIWSNETHPKDYPYAIWLTHFSDVIGATHDTNFSFWGENHIATDAFRSLAEWGSPTALENEIRSYGSRLRTLIKAAGLWYPNVNTNTSSKFRVDRKHHKVSLVSMFGPSPDWVVGINGLDLCTEDCSWKDSKTIDLYPWDAGTDNGITYMSPNSETQPREKMHRITTMYPEDPRAPFYNPNSNEMIPLAKIYIWREKIIPRNCDEDFLTAIQVEDISENSREQDLKPECEVTEYSAWTPCSVTCGKGLRMRSREYKNPKSAKLEKCERQLIFKEMCVASIAECGDSNVDEEDEEENLALSTSLVDETGEGIGICKTTPWSEFSECSATCGIGITMRTRRFYNYLGRKKCPYISIVEKEKCMQPECKFSLDDQPDHLCPVTQWSDWSPCSTTCGNGITIRTRVLLTDTNNKEMCEKRIKLHEQKVCTTREDCIFDKATAIEICSQKADIGPCRGTYERYAFNPEKNYCEPFVYGGCKGNTNNFLTDLDCLRTCHVAFDLKSKQDCMVSEWMEWSGCNVTCGKGYSIRKRTIVMKAENGGKACPKRLISRKKCSRPDC